MRTASLARFSGSPVTNLVPATAVNALQRDASNHVEPRCVGPTVSLLLNGTFAVSAQDSAYAAGAFYINAGNGRGTSDARITHLVVTQR